MFDPYSKMLPETYLALRTQRRRFLLYTCVAMFLGMFLIILSAAFYFT